MSAQRADSMATIDNALSTGIATDSAEPADADVVTGPDAALTPPGSNDDDKDDDEKSDKEKAKEKKQAEEDAAQAEEDAANRQSGQRDAITGAVKSTLETKHPFGTDFFRFQNLAVNLNKLPDPGGFTFPLILLLICFFILIPVNGHTRLVWLWMVITGNAYINQAGGGAGGGFGTSPGGAPPTGQNAPLNTPPPTPQAQMGSIGTLVEEY